MTARAAKLCGMNTESDEASQRDILAAFTDYTRVADWAREALAFCYSNGILPDEEIEINPQENVTREDIAQMLYNMLDAASLL